MHPSQQTAAEIVAVCKRLYARNLLAAADGNVSVRIAEDEILMTPSGVSKQGMDPADMARIRLNGEVISGRPSTEKLMHLTVYQNCPQAKAVVHAHPPTAIAWSVAEPHLKELPCEALSEVILATGGIPIAPYARPSTQDMGEVLKPFLPQHRVLIMARHGGISWGESLEEAYLGMERMEHSAEILMRAKQLGAVTSLPQEEVAKLWEMRHAMGGRTL